MAASALAWVFLLMLIASSPSAALLSLRGRGRLFHCMSRGLSAGAPGALHPPGQSLVICGPSGAGKGTLIHRLLQEYPSLFALSVSHTSRAPRPGEVDGVHYHFRPLEELRRDMESGSIPFIETASVHGNLYGTRQDAVDSIHAQGKICVLDVDVRGVKSIKAKQFPGKYLFIRPPTLSDLETRLRNRGTETEASLQLRLRNAQEEMEYGEARTANATLLHFNHVLVNDHLEDAWSELHSLLRTWFSPHLPSR